jgi:Ca2+-binding RTX toxin-like protein
MTAFTGTNSYDILVGTEHADRFMPLLGVDDVDGRGGVDTLVVDYSSLSNSGNQSLSYIFSNGSSWEGYLYTGSADGYVTFRNVEKIEAKLDGGDNVLIVFPAAAVQGGATLDLDGGAGNDTLNLQLSDVAFDTVLQVAANGKVHTNLGKFANFEDYEIFLGAGNHLITTGSGNDDVVNWGDSGTINTGAGSDIISSIGSIDTVDGGEGFDRWQAEYGESTQALNFTFDGSVASLSNGTTARNIEGFNMNLGMADDEATITGFSEDMSGVYGGSGFDTLHIEAPDTTQPELAVIASTIDGEIHGTVGPNSELVFEQWESVDYVAGDGDTNLLMFLQEMVPGGNAMVDGAAGWDSAYVLYWPEEASAYTLQAGLLETDFGVTLVNFEYVNIDGVGGDDSFSATGEVLANFDGGWGYDSATIDYSAIGASAEAQVFGNSGSLHGWAVAGSASVSYNNVESVDLILGDGFDLVTVGGLEQVSGASVSADAGGGRDRLDINLLDFGDVVFEADDSGIITSNTGATFANFEDYTVWVGASINVVTTASGNDQVYSYFGGSSIINTGGGDDYIESLLSTDSVNGGDGYDSWSGEYQAAYDGMSFVLGEEDPDADVSVAYVEQVQLNAGSGDDVMDVNGDLYAILYGGGGSDLLSLDYASDSEDAAAEIFGGNGSLHGWLVKGGANITYDAVESVEMRLGSGSDQVSVGLLEEAGGSAIFVDAGEGRDRLDINLLNFGNVIIETDDSGNVTTNTGATFANFEDYTVWLGAANNVVTTGSGDDQITSYFGGTNVISTGRGDDKVSVGLFASSPGASLTADGGDGFDQLELDLSDAPGPIEISIDETGITVPNLDISVSNFEYFTLTLGSSDDVINLGAVGASIDAGAGNDVINGGSAGTWLDGGDGDDVISGGDGFDFLVGRAGADRFVFQDGADDFIIDFLWDFASGEGDIIDLLAVDADANTAGDQAFTFIGTDSFSGTAGELRIEDFEPGQLTVQGDMNGDGQAELWLLVQGPTTLSSSDFFF